MNSPYVHKPSGDYLSTSYYYIVTSVSAAGESAESAQTCPLRDFSYLSPPAPPAGICVWPGDAQVTITWNSTNATNYNVDRSTTAGISGTVIGTPTGASYLDTAVSNGIPYYYQVSTVNGSGEGTLTAQASATPQVPASDAPTGVGVSHSNGNVTVTWSAASAAGLGIVGSANDETVSEACAVNMSESEGSVTGLICGRSFSY